EQGTARKVLAAASGAAVLFAEDRRRLATLVAGVRHPLVPPRRRGPLRDVRRCRSYLPLARLRPDVVHFAWDAAAVHNLALSGVDPHPITGDHSQRPKLLYTIQDLGLDGRARLHGEVPHAEVRNRLHDADVLLHPSLSEGIPTVVLEAMACGLPVVVTDCGG